METAKIRGVFNVAKGTECNGDRLEYGAHITLRWLIHYGTLNKLILAIMNKAVISYLVVPF